MKKILPVLISICAVSCINACDDSQKVVQGSHDDSLPNVKMEVHIDDVKQGEVNVQDMADFVQSVTASGETSNAIAISDFIQQINNVPDNELDTYLDQYLCDYQSNEDGMKVSDKGDRCPLLSCIEAKRSYYNVDSNNLFYSDDMHITLGCYKIRQLGKILMLKKTNASTQDPATQEPGNDEKPVIDSYEIEITYDGTSLGKIDLANLADKVQKVDSKYVIMISDIIKAAKSDIDLAASWCDYFGTDGWSPKDDVSHDCIGIRSCSYSKSAYIDVADTTKRKLVFGGDSPKCYSVKNFSKIVITSTDPNNSGD
jgi:hypothetical protein